MAQHLSTRVPWHDNGWNGFVCKHPEHNQACRILKNIAEDKDDIAEKACASCKVASKEDFIPPCVTESGMFMSPHEVCATRKHPYTYDKHFNHIKRTEVHAKAYSFIGTPYNWTLKEDRNNSPNDRYYTQYDPKKEIDVGSGSWVSNGINQKHIFDYFYNDVIANESIVVAYAKAVPFVESSGRVIIGIGMVSSLGDLKEYDYSEQPDGVNKIKSFLWEREISHTIRPDRSNGFLFPFEEIQAYLKEHPRQRPEDLVYIVPDEYRNEFSYATEHLSHDALIMTLNGIIQVLRKYKEIKLNYGTGKSWDDCISWCEKQFRSVWKDRGAYPGLGAVLSALGIPYGYDIATAIKKKYKDEELWNSLSEGLENLTKLLSLKMKGIALKLTKTLIEDLEYELEERAEYLKLLSSISLTSEQAALLLNDDVRNSRDLKYASQLTDIHIKDCSVDIVSNPYLLCEKTYMLEPQYQIGIGKIDIAVFQSAYLTELEHEEDYDKLLSEPDDKRRLRAIILSILENEARNGSSLMFINDVISAVGKFRSDVPEIETSIRLKTIKRLRDYFKEVFFQLEVETILEDNVENTETALKLKRLEEVDIVIRKFIDERLNKTNNINDKWGNLLDDVLKSEKLSNGEREQAAREEKIRAIEKMAKSQVSVLTGGAGTGKTTTLVALCMNEAIQRGRILILAPTGKARVVLSAKLNRINIEHTAQTLFQYLKNTNHCDYKTWSYYLSGKQDANVPETVIIDECSMLTEEMFGALAEAISSAKRIIFVGDPNQLPPIGTGKPFYELVQKLRLEEGQPHYANLLVSNRQKQNDSDKPRLDVAFSKLFTEDMASQVSDDIFELMAQDNENIDIIKCENVFAVPQTISDILKKEMGIKNVETFDNSLGGSIDDEWINFNDAKAVDDWQILTPYKNKEIVGSLAINRYIQLQYRPKGYLNETFKRASTKHPLGTDAVGYGEKIINVKNHNKKGYSLIEKQMVDGYVANGEIGIVQRIDNAKKYHYIVYSSQDELSYRYSSKISEESDIELAYALTTHKAQGSGFKMTIFILMEPERGIYSFIVRELLYTALTRQSEKVCIIYNKEPSELKKYANPEYSDLAHRKTNLFIPPVFRELKSGWYDSYLIHTTLKGERVRSKSEVIVADALYRAGIDYEYEKLLTFSDGEKALPDFTITKDNGEMIYWEHLGMLGDYGYRKDWERKKQKYADHGITIENGLLNISQDELSGGINSQEIETIIDKIKNGICKV